MGIEIFILRCTELQAIWSKLDPFRLFLIVLLHFQFQKKVISVIFIVFFLIRSLCPVLGHGPGPGPGPCFSYGPRPNLVPVPHISGPGLGPGPAIFQVPALVPVPVKILVPSHSDTQASACHACRA